LTKNINILLRKLFHFSFKLSKEGKGKDNNNFSVTYITI